MPQQEKFNTSKMICDILKRKYDTDVFLVDGATKLIQIPLNKAKSYIKVGLNKLSIIETQLDNLIDIINMLYDMLNVNYDGDNVINLGNCNALKEYIQDYLGYSNSDFEKLKDGLGNINLLQNFFDAQVSYIEVEIDTISDDMSLIDDKIDDLLDLYQTAIEKDVIINIYNPPNLVSLKDTLDFLNAYGECIFSTCDYSETAQNKLSDVREKLFLKSDNNVNRTEIKSEYSKLKSNINIKIDDINSAIVNLKSGINKKLDINNVSKSWQSEQ